MRLIADCGLPIMISTQWTEDQYQDYDEFDYMKSTTVKGWRVRINGRVYPRNHVNSDGTDDWTTDTHHGKVAQRRVAGSRSRMPC